MLKAKSKGFESIATSWHEFGDAVAMSLKHLIWHLVCVRGWISQPMVVLCPVFRICTSQSINWQKCHSKTSAFKRRSAIPAKTTGETARQKSSSHAQPRPQTARLKHVRHIEIPRSAKHEANNRLYKIWPLRQKIAVAIWPSAAQRYILRYFKRNLRHLLTWLCIEESTCVPAQPLHPACSNCHPAKSRVLITQRARKHNLIPIRLGQDELAIC